MKFTNPRGGYHFKIFRLHVSVNFAKSLTWGYRCEEDKRVDLLAVTIVETKGYDNKLLTVVVGPLSLIFAILNKRVR